MAGAMDQKLPKIRDEERESKVSNGKNFKQGKGNLKGQCLGSGSGGSVLIVWIWIHNYASVLRNHSYLALYFVINY
jgi:hypothetical protein